MKNLKEKKIGFIVESDSDANFIRYFMENYFKNKIPYIVIPAFGKAAMASSSKIIVSQFISLGVDYVFILFDTEGEKIKNILPYIEEPLEKAELMSIISIIPIHPFFENWILSSFKPITKLINKETKNLEMKALGFEKQPYIFTDKNIDFNKIKANNKDFLKFVQKVEAQIAA